MSRLESGAHVPAHLLPQWQQSSLDARVHAVMTPHVWSAPGEEREFKRTVPSPPGCVRYGTLRPTRPPNSQRRVWGVAHAPLRPGASGALTSTTLRGDWVRLPTPCVTKGFVQ